MILFEREEFLSRVARVKRRMVEAGIDVLLVASPANQFWLTGYDGWSFHAPQMVAVSLAHEEPIWIGQAIDAAGARLTAFLAADNVVPCADNYFVSSERHPLRFVAEELTRGGWAKGTIGVEMDDYYYTARWHALLTEGLPGARLVDATLLVNRCRMVKSAREIQFMREAGAIAGAAMRAAFEAAEVGARQCDVMAEVSRVTTAGLPGFGGAFPCKPPLAIAGTDASAPHLSWTDARLGRGDLLYIELGGVRHHYHAPLARCVSLGAPAPGIADMVAAIVEGLEAVLAAARPGATCADVAMAWQRVAARRGIDKYGRIGYPVGIGYPPTWGELTASLRIGDRMVLEPGMTFHCIPAVWLNSCGLVVSESFVVTESGTSTLADFPREFLIKS